MILLLSKVRAHKKNVCKAIRAACEDKSEGMQTRRMEVMRDMKRESIVERRDLFKGVGLDVIEDETRACWARRHRRSNRLKCVAVIDRPDVERRIARTMRVRAERRGKGIKIVIALWGAS